MDRAYWDRLINLDVMIEEGFIRPDDRGLYAFAETAEEAWAILERQGLAVP